MKANGGAKGVRAGTGQRHTCSAQEVQEHVLCVLPRPEGIWFPVCGSWKVKRSMSGTTHRIAAIFDPCAVL